MTEDWIDISVRLHAGMPRWPGDDPFRLDRLRQQDDGGESVLSTLSMSAHAGTHMDAPLHYLAGGATMDNLPIPAVVGEARVIEIRNREAVTREELLEHDIQRGERLLFKTRNSERCWEQEDFCEDYVYVSPEGAQFLAEKGVQTVGVDYLSVGAFKKDGPETHRFLLRAGIWIIEGLDLRGVAPCAYELICLPLKVAAAEGAPARAVIRPFST